ncbi:hypothetical protein P9112_003424 [Eukaryota sp. TZLM1-RC]
MDLPPPLHQILKKHLITIQSSCGADVVLINHFLSEETLTVLVSSDDSILAAGTSLHILDAYCCCVKRIKGQLVITDACRAPSAEGLSQEDIRRPFEASGFRQYVGSPSSLGGFGFGTVCMLKKDQLPLIQNTELTGLGARLVSLELVAWYPRDSVLEICSVCDSHHITDSQKDENGFSSTEKRPVDFSYADIEVPQNSARMTHTVCSKCMGAQRLTPPIQPGEFTMDLESIREALLPSYNTRIDLPHNALVADDSQAIRLVMGKLLQHLEVEAVSFSVDGIQTLELLVQNATTLTICFIDEIMPNLRGSEAVRQYRKWEFENLSDHYPVLYIVAITGLKGKRMRSYLEAAGFNDVIFKPLTKEKIQSAMENAHNHYVNDASL